MIKKLSEVSLSDRFVVGGKAASLGFLVKNNIRVPDGFVVVGENYNCEEVLLHFESLGVEHVAVRSSALCEDGNEYSWAGQFESYLFVTKENLIETIQKCRNSSTTSRSLHYKNITHTEKSNMQVSVIVQRMILSEKSGVMFTSDPVFNKKDCILVEACFGQCESLVSGKLIPDTYEVNKNDTTWELVGNTDCPQQEQSQVLSNQELQELVSLGNRIERLFGFSCDIEWAFEKKKLWILQSRAITTS